MAVGGWHPPGPTLLAWPWSARPHSRPGRSVTGTTAGATNRPTRRPMRICIGARPLGAVVTGLGRYASCLVQQLAAVDRTHEYVVLRRPGAQQPLVCQDNFVEVPLAGGMFSARNLLTGARAIGRYRVDLYHALFHFLPLGRTTCRTVITLHDLTWVKHPFRFAGSRWRRGLRAAVAKPMIRHAVTVADHVITTSENHLGEHAAAGYPTLWASRGEDHRHPPGCRHTGPAGGRQRPAGGLSPPAVPFRPRQHAAPQEHSASSAGLPRSQSATPRSASADRGPG